MKRTGAEKFGLFRRVIKPYLYIAPAVIFLSIFTIYPVLRQIYLSFFNANAVFSVTEFAGLAHYRAMAADPVFWEVVKNTLLYGALQVFFSICAGLGCALAAGSRLCRCGSFFKTAVVYPYMLPWTAAAMIWMFFFHPVRGIVNALLGTRIQWLNDFHLTLFVLAFIAVWKTTGFSFLLFFSALQTIPADLYESLRLETGSRLRSFVHITLPMLGPAFFAVLLLSIAGSFQSADLVYIATQGRPGNTTNVLIYHIYQQGIARWNIGYGSALSVVLFLALLFFTLGYVLLGEKKVHYDN